ncbi:MAG: hypothetical protein BWY19_00789 [bacterium ADurb.Bin212]|nr:MAG: hypothetical protein BWY19_00789 [bacterium ADurb.Bin212]
MKMYIILITLLFTTLLYAQSKNFIETDEVVIGKPQSGAPAGEIRFRNTTQKVRGNKTTGKLEFTNDGSTFKELGSGSGGAGGVNLLSAFNADFETSSPPANWTSSGGTFVSDTATEIFGTQSGVWDSSASAQTLCSNATTIERGMIGQKCQAQIYYRWPSGVANDIRMLVKDTAVEVATVNLTPTTGDNVTSAILVYDCPDTATDTLQMCLESTVVNPAAITVDNAFLGSGNSMITEKPQDVFSAKVSTTDVVSSENVDFISGNCTNGSTGFATCTFTSNFFASAPNCTCTITQAASGSDQTCNVDTVTASSIILNTRSSGALTDRNFNLTCQKVESSANRSAVTLETSGQSWSGFHDSTCSWSRTNVAYGDPTADATCAFTQRSNAGFGTVVSADSAGNKLPGIVFTPNTSGKYFVSVIVNDIGCNASNSEYAIQLVDGSGTVVSNAAGDCAGGGTEGSVWTMSGFYQASAGSAVTLKIQSRHAGGVAIVLNKNGLENATNWTLFKADQTFPAPVFTELQNLIKAENGAMKIAAAKLTAGVCSVSPCTPLLGAEGITSITRSSAGTYIVNFDGSYFSDASSIICTYSEQSNTNLIGTFNTYAVGTVNLLTKNLSGTATDSAMGVYCIGK